MARLAIFSWRPWFMAALAKLVNSVDRQSK